MRMAVARDLDLASILSQSSVGRLFRPDLELVPQLNEVYELELAFLESLILSDEEIIKNGAYFARVGDTLTRHFLMCSGEPVLLPKHSSSRLRSFFQTNQFKTGYATHGLFPYRGKFHPQMVKGLLNAMGLKPGDRVLDPMMGSGTVLIEARLMGVSSVGIDASPFCRFMTQAKVDGLTVPLEPVREALQKSGEVFRYFRSLVGEPVRAGKRRARPHTQELLEIMEPKATYESPHKRPLLPVAGMADSAVANFLLLGYLDSAGYSERSDRVSSMEQFRSILARYRFVAEKIQSVLRGVESQLAPAQALVGDARAMKIDDSSVDGILFSPPYSFAIDYLGNDSFHLGVMGVDIDTLRGSMIGLRGRTPREKFELYKRDMDLVLHECARVIRPNKICTVVVGTNNNQLARILGVDSDKVQSIGDLLVDLGRPHGLRLLRKITRQITGMANTMRDEYILMFQRVSG